MSDNTEAIYKFQSYKQRQGHDIGGVRPVMIPDDDGDWVGRHDAEHLADMLKSANKRIEEFEDKNEYLRKRFKELDLMFGKNLLVMQAAIIEWRTTGDAKNGIAWIFNTLLGPGELPSGDEKDAQAYFDREYAPLDTELMALHQWFYELRKRTEAIPVSSNTAKGAK